MNNKMEDCRKKADNIINMVSSLKNDIKNVNGEKQNVYFIDLDKWGIYNGFLEDREYILSEDGISYLPKYTDEEYEIAHNNKEGLNKALQYAVDNGYEIACLPNNSKIFICWEESNPSCSAYYAYNKKHILLPSNLTFDMNNSTIKVIFDSKNVNPYDKSQHNYDNPIYRLNGCLISIESAYNSGIKNGTLIGTLYERAFIIDKLNETGSEKNFDFGVGINIAKGSSFINIENMVIKGFMADGIASITDHDPNKGNSLYNPPFNYVGNIVNGELNTITTSYTTEFLDISKWNCKEAIMRTNMGYTRVPDIYMESFLVSFYDKDKNFILTSKERYLQNFLIPINAKYLRISIIREDEGKTLGFGKNFQITPKAGEFCHIHFCEITENHRGGIANMINNTIIEKCKIYNNGLGTYEDVGIFGDSTRYCINCEDCLPLNLIVRDNYFYQSFHGILFAGGTIYCQNNIFNKIGGNPLNIYNCENAFFVGNTVSLSGTIGGCTGSSVYNRTFVIKDNKFIDSSLSISNNSNMLYQVSGNTFVGCCSFNNSNTNEFKARDIIMQFARPDDTTYIGGSCNASNTENVLILINGGQVSTSRFGLTTNKNTKDLTIKNISTTENSKVGGNNFYNSKIVDLGDIQIGINDIKEENITIERQFKCNIENCNIINTGFELNGYSSVQNGYILNAKNTTFTYDNNFICSPKKYIYRPYDYSNEYNKRYEHLYENCIFDISSDIFIEFISGYQCIAIGSIIFNDCTFINNTTNDITIYNRKGSEGSTLTLNFNNCKFNGNFKPLQNGESFIKAYKDDILISNNEYIK